MEGAVSLRGAGMGRAIGQGKRAAPHTRRDSKMTTYPRSYHVALNALIDGQGSALNIRRIVARALRDLRRTLGHARARRERQHMYFVGDIPPKTRRI